VEPERTFNRPTSVLVWGTSRPLLNWVVYALASEADPKFIWTDVRRGDEVMTDADPLVHNMVPPDRLAVVYPGQLAPNDAAANMAIAGVIRDDRPTDAVRRLVDFVRLPLSTQRLLTGVPSRSRPMVLVLSDAQHMVVFYPTATVASLVRAVVEAGAILFVTFVNTPPQSRQEFETVLHVEGNDPRAWREATLRVEKGPSAGPLRGGSTHRLSEFNPIATVLAHNLKP